MNNVTLEGREIKPNDLPCGFYLYRFEGQATDAVPRRTREEILMIIGSSNRDIELRTANMPFAGIYKNRLEDN